MTFARVQLFICSCMLMLLITTSLCATVVRADDTTSDWTPLFDGRTFDGWNGNLDWFRINDGAIVAGTLDRKIPRNEFLATDDEYGDFELKLKFKLIGKFTNAGVQIRSRRIPDDSEMIGYQADLGNGWWGSLYDESRRRKMLVQADEQKLNEVLRPDDWNEYRIRCQGRRVQLWINDHQTVDYTEPDESLEQQGLIGLQIHAGRPGEAWYKDIVLRKL